MTTSTAAIPDLRPELGRALDQVERVLRLARPDQAGAPTPCDELDVGGLVDHLQGVVRRLAVILSGEHFSTAPPMVHSTDWIKDWQEGRAALDRLLAEDANLDREVAVPWGATTGAGAVRSYIGELTVHTWDLATALGHTDGLDSELADTARAGYEAILPAEPRGGPRIPFGPVVEVGPDAGPYERLVAWTGRDPRWSQD